MPFAVSSAMQQRTRCWLENKGVYCLLFANVIRHDKVYITFTFFGILTSCLYGFLAVRAAPSLQWKWKVRAGASVAAVSWMSFQLRAEEESQPARACSYLATHGMYSVLSFTWYGSDLWRITIFAALQEVNFKVSSAVLLMKIKMVENCAN